MTSVTIYVYAILHGADMQECFHACATCTLRLCEFVGHRLSFRTFGNSLCPRVARVHEIFLNARVLQVCCQPGSCFVFFLRLCVPVFACGFFACVGFPGLWYFPHGVSGVSACFTFACVFLCVCLCVCFRARWVCCGVCIGVVGCVCLCLCLCCICVIVFGVFACFCVYAFFVRVSVVVLV